MQKNLRLVAFKIILPSGNHEPAILDAVEHYRIEFSTGYPVQSRLPKYITFQTQNKLRAGHVIC